MLTQNLGILVSNAVNYGVRDIQTSDWSWRIVILIGIVFSLPLGIGVLFCVESPRWLMGQGRPEEAKLAMARLRGVKDDPNNALVERDFREMREGIEAEKSVGNASWLECFTGKPSGITRLAYRTYLGCALQFLQVRALIGTKNLAEIPFCPPSNGLEISPTF